MNEGKAIVVQSMSMHATEVGGTQMAPELAYDLLARKDEEARRILDNVIFIECRASIPTARSWSPTGTTRQLGTPYEGTSPPWLYQKYAGHDNNRDAFMTNIPDSQYMAKILFTEWKPEAYVDHHHMGGNGARIYLPPYAEPVRPWRRSAPLARAELVRRAHGVQRGRGQSRRASINGAIYSGWGHFGFHWITPFHNIAGMLTESASARLRRRCSSIPISCAAARAICRSTKSRRFSRIRGRADGGGCATSWSGRKCRRGPRSISRRAIARRCCGTRI